MFERVKRDIAPLCLGLVVGAILCFVVVVLILDLPGKAESLSDPVPAPNVGALDLSAPDGQYKGFPYYDADFYLRDPAMGRLCPAWVVKVEGKTYLAVCDGVRAYLLEGVSWSPE